MIFAKPKWIFGVFFSLLAFTPLSGQNFLIHQGKLKTTLGLNYGKAAQKWYPGAISHYRYQTDYLKLELNFLRASWRKVQFEVLVEPSIYFSEHQLLDTSFIRPESGPDYEDRRLFFNNPRKFQEFALNVGWLTSIEMTKSIRPYFLLSIGPMIGTKNTERLKKGFAFSDLIGLGFFYLAGQVVFDLRLTLRHNSNANLFFPNAGHNSLGLETGISLILGEDH